MAAKRQMIVQRARHSSRCKVVGELTGHEVWEAKILVKQSGRPYLLYQCAGCAATLLVDATFALGAALKANDHHITLRAAS